MTTGEFENIMNIEDDTPLEKYRGQNTTLLGLKIIEKYMPGTSVSGADQDIIYSVSIEDIVDAGTWFGLDTF